MQTTRHHPVDDRQLDFEYESEQERWEREGFDGWDVFDEHEPPFDDSREEAS